MTANQVKGKGFRGALRYNLEKMEKNLAEVLDTNFANVLEKSIMNEVRMIRSLRPNLQKYFYHTSLNFPPDEDLSNEKMTQIAKDYLDQNGFNQHQYVLFRHYDADHPHLHILANRIGFDGRVLSDSQDNARSEKVLRELEKKYGLTNVISSKQAKERAMTKNELEMMKRTGEPSTKMKLQVIVKSILDRKPSTNEFVRSMEARGIHLQFNQAATGFVSGISYGYEGMVFKRSSLGYAYKWTTIKSNINYEQERDRATIYSANLRTKRGSSVGGLGKNIEPSERDTELAPPKRVQIPAGTTQNYPHPGNGFPRTVSEGAGCPLSVELPGTNDKEYFEADRIKSEKTGQAAVLAGNLIRDLFRTPDHDTSDDMAQVNQFKKKKKRRS